MAQAARDQNLVTTLLGVSSSDGVTPVALWADPITHRLLTQATGGAAPIDATYVTLSTNATLTNERVLTGTANQVTLTDNGAGSTIVLSLPQSIAVASTPTFASMTLTGANSLTLGTASSLAGSIILKNGTNANTVTILSGVTTGTYTLTLPTAVASAGQFLKDVAGNGVLSWATPAGAGTVTDVSVTTANGVSGSVATSTSTPAISITLGDITPSSVTSTGVVKASANDGAALGASGTGWSDLFLASGAVVNFAAGNMTITHSAATLTIAGGTLVFPTPFTLGATSVTTTGTQLNYLNAATGTTGTTSTNVVFSTSPTLVTPVLGVATATSINKVAFTAPATSATLTISDGKTLSATQSITLSGTDSTVMTFPTTSASVARTDAGQTFTGVQVMTSPSITTANLTGTQLLAENASIGLDPAGSADGKFTGITVTAIAGYTQAFGDLVYLDPTDSRWEATDANSAEGADGDARGILGLVVVAGTDGNACTILLNGIIRADAKFPTFTVNNPIYVSETAGLVTQTQPTTTDVVIRVVGAALTADEMYFSPSYDYITHT